jgi:hypothetical protein
VALLVHSEVLLCSVDLTVRLCGALSVLISVRRGLVLGLSAARCSSSGWCRGRLMRLRQ